VCNVVIRYWKCSEKANIYRHLVCRMSFLRLLSIINSAALGHEWSTVVLKTKLTKSSQIASKNSDH